MESVINKGQKVKCVPQGYTDSERSKSASLDSVKDVKDGLRSDRKQGVVKGLLYSLRE